MIRHKLALLAMLLFLASPLLVVTSLHKWSNKFTPDNTSQEAVEATADRQAAAGKKSNLQVQSDRPPAPAAADLNTRDLAQVLFLGPEGLLITWNISAEHKFDSEPLSCPGRFNFPKGYCYAIKLSKIPGHDREALFPTLEIAPSLPRSEKYLAFNAIPLQIDPEDISRAIAGERVTKVVYLEDAQSENLDGTATITSSSDHTSDETILYADSVGTIMAILRF